MALTRQNNYISQERVDIPALRSIESAICNDFDLLAGASFAGKNPLVVSGFHVVTTGITAASSLILQPSDSIIIHFLATASGSLFHIQASEPDQVLNNTNPKIIGGWVPNVVNYVGIDIIRQPDSTTADLVEVIDTVALTEEPVTSPLGVTTDYRIIISNSDFDSNPGVCPIATVTLDSSGNITNIQDARNFMFRLGSGGTVPNTQNSYSWPGGRKEVTTGDIFNGTDKAIESFKNFSDAIETRLWELGGGENWYSPTADRNVRLATTGSPFSSTGMNFEFVSSNLHWKGLVLVFDNSTGVTNAIADQTTSVAGLTDLVSGQCIFVDVDRTTTRSGGTSLVAQKGTLSTLGTPTVPGSRWVLAWNYGGSIFIRDQVFAVGSSFIAATVTAAGTVKLSASDSLISPAYVATVDSQTYSARAAGLSRGFNIGRPTTASVSDFIGSTGNITIGGGQDGADGHGGGNPVDFDVIVQTTRNQDEVLVQGTSNYPTNGASVLSSAFLGTINPANVILRLANQSSSTDPTTRKSTHHFFSDGSIGLINIGDASQGDVATAPPTPAPTTSAEVRTKVFTRSNGLSTPNQRDQYCIIQWDGSIMVFAESNPY